MAIRCYPGQHEETGCALASGQGPGRLAPAGGWGGARGAFPDRGRRCVRSRAGHGDPLDGVVGTARGEGISGPSSRTTAASASEGPAVGPGRAADREPLPGTVAVALRAVDAGSGPTGVCPAVWGAGFGLDGGPVPARLGSDPAETGAAVLRTRPGS